MFFTGVALVWAGLGSLACLTGETYGVTQGTYEATERPEDRLGEGDEAPCVVQERTPGSVTLQGLDKYHINNLERSDTEQPDVILRAEGPKQLRDVISKADEPDGASMPLYGDTPEQESLVDDAQSSPPYFVVFDEVYDAEHLRDVLFSRTSGKTLRHAVLVFYNHVCEDQVHALRMFHCDLKMPDDFYVYFAVHDYETVKKYTWYNMRPEDDLMAMFNLPDRSCQVVFLPKDSTDKTKPIILQNYHEFDTWLWDLVKVKVTLVNSANESIRFRFHGNHTHIPDIILNPEEQETVEVYTSYLLSATGNKGFYGGWVIGYSTRILTVAMVTDRLTEMEFVSSQYDVMEERRQSLNDKVWDYTDRHLLNRKQPLMVRNLTTLGYKKLKMPAWLQHQLVDFYEENKQFRESELWLSSNTLINMDQNRCGMVNLDRPTKAVVISGTLPLLEEWCQCRLTMTAFYGIREYYKGHRLKNHLDRVATHVISVILQVAQDLDGGPDWQLEVITYSGERKQITLEAGEMLLYESASLIHGRPKTFQGKLMANAFLHFKPTDGWLYDRPASGELYYDGEFLAAMHPLPDPRTLWELENRAESRRSWGYVKDEL